MFKSVFDENHTSLCSDAEILPTDLLFGGDLARTCKEMSDQSSVLSKAFVKKKVPFKPNFNRVNRGGVVKRRFSTSWSNRPSYSGYNTYNTATTLSALSAT